MAWVKIDIDEMGRIGTQLQQAAGDLDTASVRLVSASCCGGLGRHSAQLQAEAAAVRVRLQALGRQYHEFALEAVLRALVVALQEQIARNPTATAIGLGTGVKAPDNVWRPVPPAVHREWVRKGWLPASSLNPPSSNQALAQKNMEQMNNNVISNRIMKGIDARNGVMTPLGIAPSFNAMKGYQENVSSMGHRGVRAETYRAKTGY